VEHVVEQEGERGKKVHLISNHSIGKAVIGYPPPCLPQAGQPFGWSFSWWRRNRVGVVTFKCKYNFWRDFLLQTIESVRERERERERESSSSIFFPLRLLVLKNALSPQMQADWVPESPF
jgi:hypothetical protein